jgi:hypothetical protein
MYVLVVVSVVVCDVVVSVGFVPVWCVELYYIVSFVVVFPLVFVVTSVVGILCGVESILWC